jgi:DNA-binding response OmpR family regulator
VLSNGIVPASFAMQSARLLIIGDDAEAAAVVQTLAQGQGYETLVASEVRDVPRLVDSFKPTDVFVDASMDQLGGVEGLLVLSQLGCDANIIACGQPDPRFAEALWRFSRVSGLTMVEVLSKPLHLPTVSAILASLRHEAAPRKTAAARNV